MSAALAFVPDEHKHIYSAMTGQSLFYMGASTLKHKVLAIAEEVGAKRASYALKLLQSDGGLTISSTTKEPGGRLVAHEYRVEGPVAILTSTTSMDVDDELLNRCLVLTIDEGPEQTRRIHDAQRHAVMLDGLKANEERAAVVTLHQNAQRLLRPLRVVNPLASTMSFADLRVRARRDHRKLLGLVEALALLHQHQRRTKTLEHESRAVDYIESEERDVALAEKLIADIGGGGVGPDDLLPQTRRLLGMLDGFARDRAAMKSTVRFRRRDVREALGLGDTQLKIHLRRLVEAEMVVAHRTSSGGLVYSMPVHEYDEAKGSTDPARSGSGRPLVGPEKLVESEVSSRPSVEGATSDATDAPRASHENVIVREGER